jgi:hypothetical protein
MPTPRDSRWSRSLRVWLTSVLIVGLCQLLALAQETVFLVGSGSNVPAPLYNKWAEEYNKRTPRIQLRYLSIGTSEGIEEISRASGDFGAGEYPRNPRSLFGLLRALEAQNKSANVQEVRREFESAWKNADVPLELRDL